MRKLLARRKKDERGAVIVMVALMLSILLLATSLALEVGNQRVKSRSMQALANVVSLDLSRRLDGYRTTEKLKTPMDAALERSLERNEGDAAGIVVTYTLGHYAADGTFTEATASEIPKAVKVTAKQTETWTIVDKEATSARTAISTASVIPGSDCIRIGSYNGIAGTNGDDAIQAFFRTLGQKASMFRTTSDIGNLDYYAMLTEEINMTGVATRLGYPSIKHLQQATVPLKTFYKAVYEQMAADTPGTSATNSAYYFWTNALEGAPSMPMSYLMGPSVSGDVKAGVLDILGGTLAWHAGPTSPINPDLSDIPSLKNATGTFHYTQGARLHCAKPGQVFSTSPTTSGPVQMEISTNGTLDPVYYPVRFYVPGLMDVSTTTGSPANFKIVTSVEPIQMKFNSISCNEGVKTASFDILKGDIDFTMDQSWSVGMNNLNIYLEGYGPVQLSFKVAVGFKAHVELAPMTASVSATREQLGQPLWFADAHNTLTWSKTDGTVFNNFAISGAAVSAADQQRIKDAILAGLIKPMLDIDYADSLASTFLTALLGTSGGSLRGPSIIFDGEEITCGLVEHKTLPRLVG